MNMFLPKYHMRAGVWLKIRDFHWVHLILSYVSSKEELELEQILAFKIKVIYSLFLWAQAEQYCTGYKNKNIYFLLYILNCL